MRTLLTDSLEFYTNSMQQLVNRAEPPYFKLSEFITLHNKTMNESITQVRNCSIIEFNKKLTRLLSILLISHILYCFEISLMRNQNSVEIGSYLSSDNNSKTKLKKNMNFSRELMKKIIRIS